MTDAVNVTYQILQVKKDIRNRESYIDTLQRSGGVCFDVIVYFLCQYVLALGAFWLPLHLAKEGRHQTQASSASAKDWECSAQ